jgi:hypothetical protein
MSLVVALVFHMEHVLPRHTTRTDSFFLLFIELR